MPNRRGPSARCSARSALRMHDAGAGRHQVQLARLDGNGRAEAVAVHDLAVEQVGDGGEADVRMRAHVDAGADEKLGRPHLVEEDEGADHLPPRRRQRTAHGKAAEIAGARHDDLLDGVAGAMVARLRIFGGCPAHLFRSLARCSTWCIWCRNNRAHTKESEMAGQSRRQGRHRHGRQPRRSGRAGGRQGAGGARRLTRHLRAHAEMTWWRALPS